MQIINTSKNTTLSTIARPAQNLKDNALGLIARQEGNAMIFRTRFGIHTFFMKYPIDILVLDKKHRVYKLKEKLLPFKFFFWNPFHYTIIELPAGTIQHSKTKKGDIIDII